MSELDDLRQALRDAEVAKQKAEDELADAKTALQSANDRLKQAVSETAKKLSDMLSEANALEADLQASKAEFDAGRTDDFPEPIGASIDALSEAADKFSLNLDRYQQAVDAAEKDVERAEAGVSRASQAVSDAKDAIQRFENSLSNQNRDSAPKTTPPPIEVANNQLIDKLFSYYENSGRDALAQRLLTRVEDIRGFINPEDSDEEATNLPERRLREYLTNEVVSFKMLSDPFDQLPLSARAVERLKNDYTNIVYSYFYGSQKELKSSIKKYVKHILTAQTQIDEEQFKEANRIIKSGRDINGISYRRLELAREALNNRIEMVSKYYEDTLQYNLFAPPIVIFTEENASSFFDPKTGNVNINKLKRIEMGPTLHEDGTFLLGMTLQHEFGHLKDYTVRGRGFGEAPANTSERISSEAFSVAMSKDRENINEALENNGLSILGVRVKLENLLTQQNTQKIVDQISLKIQGFIKQSLHDARSDIDIIPGLYSTNEVGVKFIDDSTLKTVGKQFALYFVDSLQSIANPQIGQGLTHDLRYAMEHSTGDEGVANIITFMQFENLAPIMELMDVFHETQQVVRNYLRNIRHERD